MARWTDLAEWRGPTRNQGPAMAEQRGLVIHIAEGYYEGTISWQKNPTASVSSHFVLAGPRDVPKGTPDGKLAQVVDTTVAAWTQRAGNGHWLSVECSGFAPGDALSPAQVESVAQLFARCHTELGVPLQIATSPSGKGLGHHSMGAESGIDWGHRDCPGPKIIAQKPAILARAIEIVNGDDMTKEEHDWLKAVRDAMFVGGTSCGTVPPGKPNNSIVSKLDYLIARAQAGVPVDVDEAAIAAEVAAQLDVPTAAENAKAVNDDAAARLAD